MKNKKLIVWAAGLLAAAAVLFGIYKAFGPKTASGSKAVTVIVSPISEAESRYELNTEAETLLQVMDELTKVSDFTYEGNDGGYGLFITSINGIQADYSTTSTYWAIYVNGEYGQFGADQQPVNDGDTFSFVCETVE
jgi:hypothetical protein